MKTSFGVIAADDDRRIRNPGPGGHRPSLHFRPRGFTLIELLLVLGIVTALAAGIGMAFQGGDRSVALRSAQGTLVSLLTAARGQAALTGRNAAIAVQSDPRLPGYLQCVTVAVRDVGDSAWIPADDWLQFPTGVYVLPSTEPSGPLTAPGADWTGLRSSALSAATETVNSVTSLVLSFTPRGTVSGGGNIVLTTAERLPPGAGAPIRFLQPDAVRGVSVSSYGIVTLIDDRAGFP